MPSVELTDLQACALASAQEYAGVRIEQARALEARALELEAQAKDLRDKAVELIEAGDSMGRRVLAEIAGEHAIEIPTDAQLDGRVISWSEPATPSE